MVHVYRVLKHSKTANFESTDVLFREFLLFLSRLCAEKPAVVCFREPPGANVPATHFNLQQPLVLWDPVNPAINVVQHFRRWSPLIELARKALCCLALDEDPVNALLHTDEFALFNLNSNTLTPTRLSNRFHVEAVSRSRTSSGHRMERTLMSAWRRERRNCSVSFT